MKYFYRLPLKILPKNCKIEYNIFNFRKITLLYTDLR